ncbi:hypothetical protein BJX70DRAFT_374623 [Aspergillus crustosus]
MSVSSRIKTCQTCATAKIRCLLSPGASICDRCRRLEKPCYFRPARIRQTWTKKETRIESLEKRLEQILGHSQSSDSPPDDESGDVIDRGLLSADDAAALVDYFLQYMMPEFPFVALPPHTTAGELREVKPFLFLAILSVSITEDRALQRALSEEVKAAVAERMITRHIPPTLESLQGLLVILAWGHHQALLRSAPSDVSTLLHLAVGLTMEMELDRPFALQRCCRRMSTFDIAVLARPVELLRAEQRAAIGCSLLSSCYGIITQRMCAFPMSACLESFAMELAQEPEFASDQSIIHVVRLQRIFQDIDKTSSDGDFTQRPKVPSPQDMDAFQYQFRTFKTQLQDYMNQISPHLTENNFLLASQLHTANLYLCEINLFDRTRSAHLSPDARVEILSHGLAAARNHFNVIGSMPLGQERRMSHTPWLQSGFNVILSCKLSAMVASDEPMRRNYPQTQTLCDALDMAGVLKICVDRQKVFYPGAQMTGFDFTGWLQWIQEWHRRHYARNPVQAAQSQSQSQSQNQSTRSTTSSVPSTTPVNYPPQPVMDLGVTEIPPDPLGIPEINQDMLSWPPCPDMMLADHPLYAWMDFGAIPM